MMKMERDKDSRSVWIWLMRAAWCELWAKVTDTLERAKSKK
jgi:hypothetical protein